MRAAIVMSAAAGICVALSAVASAEVGNPAATYQSAMKIALAGQPLPPTQLAAPTHPIAQQEPASKAAAPVAREVPAATPVPEQFVSEAPVPVRHIGTAAHRQAAVAGIVFAAEAKYREIEAFFGRVANAGQGAPGPGAGVPVLVLGVLGLAAVVEHHRWRSRWATDENAIDLLYARELSPPG